MVGLYNSLKKVEVPRPCCVKEAPPWRIVEELVQLLHDVI